MSSIVSNRTFLALGANQTGYFGTPIESLRQGCRLLSSNLIVIRSYSSVYLTKAHGGGAQPAYFNAVIEVETSIGALQLLRVLKCIERLAGRRKRSLNAPRPLDIDIISMGGLELGWRTSRARGLPSAVRRPRLVIPHPEAHRRRFVLVPLAEVAPGWRHPVLGVSARGLLARLPGRHGDVERVLDSNWASCDKTS